MSISVDSVYALTIPFLLPLRGVCRHALPNPAPGLIGRGVPLPVMITLPYAEGNGDEVGMGGCFQIGHCLLFRTFVPRSSTLSVARLRMRLVRPLLLSY